MSGSEKVRDQYAVEVRSGVHKGQRIFLMKTPGGDEFLEICRINDGFLIASGKLEEFCTLMQSMVIESMSEFIREKLGGEITSVQVQPADYDGKPKPKH